MKNKEALEMGKRIGQIRRRMGYSQEVLSELLDLTPKHISNIENGVVGISLQALKEFCKLSGSSMDYIVFGGPLNDDINILPMEIRDIIYGGSKSAQKSLLKHLKYYIELLNDLS